MSILEVKGLKKTYTTRFGGNQVPLCVRIVVSEAK